MLRVATQLKTIVYRFEFFWPTFGKTVTNRSAAIQKQNGEWQRKWLAGMLMACWTGQLRARKLSTQKWTELQRRVTVASLADEKSHLRLSDVT